MAESNETFDVDFGCLRLDVAKWYDRCPNGLSMLKVVYSDLIQNKYALNSCSKTMEIIGLLIGSGHLTPTDLTLLYETIKLTHQFGLEQLIKNRHPSFVIPRDIKMIEITVFTPLRQRLVNLGMELIQSEIEHICGLYNVVDEYATDSWSLILELEHRMIITENMETFVTNLRKHDLLRAIKALTEDSLNQDSTIISDKDTTDAQFRGLKLDVAKWYERCPSGLSMLKVVFTDHIRNKYALHGCSKIITLIELLVSTGYLTSANLMLLYETIKLTQQYGLEQLIKDRHPSFVISKDIQTIELTEFTPHRKRLTDLGMQLVQNEIEQIGRLYNVVEDYVKDSWSLIIDLEQRMIICEGKMEKFIMSLKKHNIPRAVNALTKDWRFVGSEHTGKSLVSNATSLQSNGKLLTKQLIKTKGGSNLLVTVSKPPTKSKTLVDTIKLAETITDVAVHPDDCLLVSAKSGILKYKLSGEYMGRVLPNAKVKRMVRLSNGEIVFSDFGDKCIKIFDSNKQTIKSIGQKMFQFPAGVHVDETANILYVADWNQGRVYMFDILSGRMTRCMGSVNTNEDQMRGLSDVTLTTQSKLLVLEHLNNRLKLYESDGKFIKVLIEPGNENGKLIKPYGMVVDQDDNIIITSEHKIQVFRNDGSFIKRIDQPEDGITKPRGLSVVSYSPRRIAVASDIGTIQIFNY